MERTLEKIVFGGGCFWCTEAVFKMMKGVYSVTPGYAGGEKENPTYEEVSGGTTGHAEVVQVEYDRDEVDFNDLLIIFFGSHDPTTLNRQGNDIGEQYRSVVLYTTEKQKDATEEFVKDINQSNNEGDLVVTEVKPLDIFYEAEDYHKNYFEKNSDSQYCAVVINPKLEKVQKKYAELLKKEYEKRDS